MKMPQQVITNFTELAKTPMYQTVLVLRDMGFFDFIVPFLLIFAIFYGLLSSTGIFGPKKEGQAARGIVSFLMGLLFLYASTFVRFGLVITDLVAKASIILVIFFLGIIIAAMFGVKWGKE